MFLNPKQINELIELLQNTHWFFIAENIGTNYVPNDVLKALVKLGFSKKKVLSYPNLAFHFGVLSQYISEQEAKKITLEQLKKAIKSNKILQLSEQELYALRVAETRAASDITGLGNKISSNLKNLIIEGSLKLRKKYERIVKKEAKESIKERKTVKQFASAIGHATKDWARDLDRIADFVFHEAYDNGRAFFIQKQYGEKAMVYKRIHAEHCSSCEKLYLKNKKTGEPRIYRLNELLGNGTNIGRKQKDWRPVIGATHPWCRCDLEFVPPGWAWDSKTRRFVPIKRETKMAKEIRRKIRVNINFS